MANNDQEKTEHQSQKKLEESRHKGELPKSQELGTFVIFSIFLIYFSLNKMGWFIGFSAIMADLLAFDKYMYLTRETLNEFMLIPVVKALGILAPLFGLILFISPLITMTQTGFSLAKDKLTPDWNRLDPVKGFGRFFSLRQYIEGLKSILKIGLFLYLAWSAVRKALPMILMMGALDLNDQLKAMMNLSLTIGIQIAILMAVLSVVDLGYQWWEFQKKLRMTHQELKDEMKEREGNPLIKQRQRSLAMQQARANMMESVKDASVVLTNPTHYAVALAYDRAKMPAPYVCAKGTRALAKRIRVLANQHGIPIVENKPLARTLYRKVKVGRPIPSEFFRAVAEVLALVYMLKRKPASLPAAQPLASPRLVGGGSAKPIASPMP